MDSYLPIYIKARTPYSVYYRSHPNKSPLAIFVCCLDKGLKKTRVKKWFLHCGKIKSIELGEITKEGKTISHAVVEFKQKQGFRRSLDNSWLEQKINEDLAPQPTEVGEEVETHIDKMEEDGFTLVLPKKRNANKFDVVEKESDVVSEKNVKKSENFYNFQITDKKTLRKMKEG